MLQVTGSLPPSWETPTEFPAPGFGPAQPWLLKALRGSSLFFVERTHLLIHSPNAQAWPGAKSRDWALNLGHPCGCQVSTTRWTITASQRADTKIRGRAGTQIQALDTGCTCLNCADEHPAPSRDWLNE